VFIIFFIAAVALAYMWHKGKKVLVSEAQDLTKLEQIIKQKKAEAEDQR
jgi:preprotein translocase subunit SecG